jgi:hypothetical protein
MIGVAEFKRDVKVEMYFCYFKEFSKGKRSSKQLVKIAVAG